ncbi:hypothetical protein ACS127_17390 [Amphibacillus sp. Q70]|uniref:hypothetical protein n=1 Tax=Amphibacillus sp. Q70 TaxID=3453416 RepID=UPI003F86464C
MTSPTATVKVEVNESEIIEHIKQRVDALADGFFIMLDVDTLAKRMCLSKRFIEDELLSDVRIKAIERKKSRKRMYFTDELIPVIKEIVYEKW